MTIPRKSILSLIVLALPTLAGCGSESAQSVTPEPPAEKTATVRTLELVPREVVDLVGLPADLLPLRRATLAAEVAGVVELLKVDEGQAVASGALLLAIDTRSMAQAVAEAEALHRQAQAQYERAHNLFERRSITKQQMLDAVTGRDVAAARLASTQLQLDKSQVKAPWGGRIAVRRVEVGDYVSLGQPLLELVDVSRLKVRAPARSIDVPYLALGTPVTVRVDAFSDEAFTARVVRLGAELNTQARTLAVEAEIPNAEGKLRPGLLARVEIPRRRIPQALTVPLVAAIDFELSKAVYVVEDGRAVRRMVELGPVIGDQVVVEKGLAPGDRVIVDGQLQVSEGQLVAEAEGA